VLPTPLLLDDANVHNVAGSVNFAGGTISLAVDGQSVFSNVAVPGLVPFESRIAFAARTGGENELAEITNLSVNFVPEPGTMTLGLLGAALVFRRRRRRSAQE
jgi:MYXO-CTERM domain-containing protein